MTQIDIDRADPLAPVDPEPATEPAPTPRADAMPEPGAATGEAAGAVPADLAVDQADLAGGGPAATLARPRGRRIALLLVLATAATALLLFTGWYLITRKPISELPLPGLTVEDVPHYEFSVYGVRRPTGVAVSASGDRIYVTQTEGETEVVVFDGKGNRLSVVQPPNTGTDHLPVYLAIEPRTGDLYVSDRPAASIYVYSRDGDYRRTFQVPTGLHGWQPLGLAFDTGGHLYVTDVSGPFNRIHEFDTDGALLRSIGKPGQFAFPNGVAVDAAGNIYVADSNNGRLLVFDATGQQRAMVRRGPGSGDLGMPRGTVIDDLDRLYVVDTTGQAVKVYQALDQTGGQPTYIGQFGVEGTDDGAFHYPNGVAADARARIYVADWNNNRVQVWTY